MKYSQAFVQGQFLCIDVLNPHTGRSSILGQTLEQIQKRYPGAELVDLAQWAAAKERALCSDPIEISRERFDDALDTLPPQNWQRAALAESFEFMEHTSGRVTTIFCRTGRRFWEFQGLSGMTLDEIVRRVAAVAKPKVEPEPELCPYQPKTGDRCHCKPGQHRDNCPDCEGTGWVIDFAKIRNRNQS